MECHVHPKAPGTAYCMGCHVFLCQACASFSNRPVFCTDCILEWIEYRIEETKVQLRLLWLVGLGTFVAFEILAALFAPGWTSALLGILLAYLAGTLLLDVPLQTVMEFGKWPFQMTVLHIIEGKDLPKATVYQYVWDRSQERIDPNQARDPFKQKWDWATAWRGPVFAPFMIYKKRGRLQELFQQKEMILDFQQATKPELLSS